MESEYVVVDKNMEKVDPKDDIINEIEMYKEIADKHYAKKNYADAITYYSKVIEIDSENFKCYSNRSACFMMLNRYTEALRDAQRSVGINKDFFRGYARVAKCALLFGNLTLLESTLKSMENLDESDSTLHALRKNFVDISTKMNQVSAILDSPTEPKDYRKALYLYDRLVESCPSSKLLKAKRAEVLVFLNRIKEALEIIDSILVVDKSVVDAVYVKGVCLFYQDCIDKAQNYFQYALKLAPDYKKAFDMYKKSKTTHNLKTEGNNLFKIGKYGEAIGIYTKALEIDSHNSGINAKLHCNRGLSYMSLNRTTEAITDFTKALQLDKNYIKALQKRAKCYSDLQDFENAVTDYETLMKLDKSVDYRRFLKDAKFALKKSQRKDYYKVLGINRSATASAIKQAYRKKALECHPDKHTDLNAAEKEKKELMFKEIGEAYGVLSDVKKKHDYDNGVDMMDHRFSHYGADSDPYMSFFFGQNNNTFDFTPGYSRF